MLNSNRLVATKLARVARHGLVDVATSSKALGVSKKEATAKLSALTRRGWLLRVRRGLYYILPLEAEPGKPTTFDDPWVLAREAFSPCYIGGRKREPCVGLWPVKDRVTPVLQSEFNLSADGRLPSGG
jgi:predicted transcriptional regulator of viral defense system